MSQRTIEKRVSARIPTEDGEFTLHLFRELPENKEHIAVVLGDITGETPVPVRIHSECFTGDVLGSRRCDCGEQLRDALRIIASGGRGILVYLRQEGRGIGLEEKLKAYNLQDSGMDTVDANLALGHTADDRDYSAAVEILEDLAVNRIRLITNNPAKLDGLESGGLDIVARIPLIPTIHKDNKDYLMAKVARMNHLIDIHRVVA
jgi:3,4-dihydroxy 2-butanone 4-phosphate synthase/GTP cyclohydrolase II